MVIAARRLRPYFQAHSIKVLTDQPLRRILHCPETSGRLIQWSIELGEFDIEYKPRIAIKAQVLADFLAEYTYPEPEELPKEEPKPWILQVLGEYAMKEEVMQKYLDKVKAQVAKLQSFSIVRIPREENIEADYLSKLATAREGAIPPNAPLRYLELPCIFAMNVQVQAVDYSNSWIGPITDYIQNGTLPYDNVKARQLKIRAAKYLIMGDVPYRRSFSLPYLRCLIPPESTRAMEEVHQGICGDHQGGRMLSYKLLRLGYY
ncbi:hypothetical protein RHGRI_016977 [Rhododendron griersonianum]|uniref:Reverse transcriptase RNase H-like domain-containing protein n=1 Tax=Rhododendron griersonianum TaxID=479676 RepID=A0AAV6JW66_9ERIC|nr:hypothetical protein RHGRI_016977 [Rhododendron griersonianum]